MTRTYDGEMEFVHYLPVCIFLLSAVVVVGLWMAQVRRMRITLPVIFHNHVRDNGIALAIWSFHSLFYRGFQEWPNWLTAVYRAAVWFFVFYAAALAIVAPFLDVPLLKALL